MNSSISPIRLERSQHKSPPRMNTRKSRKDRLNSTPSAARRLFETSSSPNRSPQSEIRKLRKSKKQPMHLKKQELSSMKPLNVKRLPDDLRVEDFYPQDITREDIEKMNDPITLRIFRNPVMINNYDGHTFDLKSITRWVKTNGTNPLTNLPITIKNITPNAELAQKTGCSLSALKKIVRKGEGAYYSSGSRPNQTPQSWGLARLASSITAGKAAAVDYDILEEGCDHNKKAFILANKSKKKYKYGHSKTKKTTVVV